MVSLSKLLQFHKDISQGEYSSLWNKRNTAENKFLFSKNPQCQIEICTPGIPPKHFLGGGLALPLNYEQVAAIRPELKVL